MTAQLSTRIVELVCYNYVTRETTKEILSYHNALLAWQEKLDNMENMEIDIKELRL